MPKKLVGIVPIECWVRTLASLVAIHDTRLQGNKSTLTLDDTDGALRFVSDYGMRKTAWSGLVSIEDSAHIEDCTDEVKAFITTYKNNERTVLKDANLPIALIKLGKACLTWLRTQSSASITYVRKNIQACKPDTTLLAALAVDSGTQAEYEPDLRKTVKKLVGINELKIPLDMIEKAKKQPDLYKHYLALRNGYVAVYKTELLNLVRAAGKPLDVELVKKHMAKSKVQHTIPEGFVGLIGETGLLYTRKGAQLAQTPQFKVVMNPAYNPTKDDTAYCKVVLPTLNADGKPNVQYFYTARFVQTQGQEKYKLVKSLMSKEKTLVARWRKDILNKDPDVHIPAAMVEISYLTCARIGSVGNASKTGATQGLSTLNVGNVRRKGTSRLLEYVGKKGVTQKHLIQPTTPTSKRVIALLDSLCEDRQRKERLFDYDGTYYSAAKVRDYFKLISGYSNIHKIRTLRATSLAKDLLETLQSALVKAKNLTQERTDEAFKDEMTKVGKLLGHVTGVGGAEKVTWTTASQSYVDPMLQWQFYASLKARGVRVPAFIEKLIAEYQ